MRVWMNRLSSCSKNPCKRILYEICILWVGLSGLMILLPAQAVQAADCGGVYLTQPGDSLSGIATLCGSTVTQILLSNPSLEDANLILSGTLLNVPTAFSNPPQVTIPASGGLPGEQVKVTASGFTPNANVEVGIQKIGGLYTPVGTEKTDADGSLVTQVTLPKTARLSEHWKILVRGVDQAAVSGPFTVQEHNYVVQAGDTLDLLAHLYGITVDAILSANPRLSRTRPLYAGDPMIIPGIATVTPASLAVLAPTDGKSGSVVALTAVGFLPNTVVNVELGQKGSNLVLQKTTQTDGNGRLRDGLKIPAGAQEGEDWAVAVSRPEDRAHPLISNPFHVTGAGNLPPDDRTVIIYLIAPGADVTSCAGDQLQAVARKVPPTRDLLRASVQDLLSIQDQFYGRSGLYNALALTDLRIDGLEVTGQMVDLSLSGTSAQAGTCEETRMIQQLEQTVLQNKSINHVRIHLNGTLLAETGS
jgi:LysM repeat protein